MTTPDKSLDELRRLREGYEDAVWQRMNTLRRDGDAAYNAASAHADAAFDALIARARQEGAEEERRRYETPLRELYDVLVMYDEEGLLPLKADRLDEARLRASRVLEADHD